MTTPRIGDEQRAERMIGFAVYGASVTGIGALIIALVAVLSGRWEAAGTCLAAAAIAFGALANALIRE